MTKLRPIARVHCISSKCEAVVHIQDEHPSGHRQLVVQYGDGRPDFAAGIPDDMTEKEILDHWLLWPKRRDAPYPRWEVPARVYGSPMLFSYRPAP
jgi:hypothetical protein